MIHIGGLNKKLIERSGCYKMELIEVKYSGEIIPDRFYVPQRDGTQSLLEMYLRKRGISFVVIGYFKYHGMMYQHRRINNGKQFSIAFVGKDEHGVVRNAAIQNIEYYQKTIKDGDTEITITDNDDAEVVNCSDESYAFSYYGGNEHLYLFDSFIGSLNFASDRCVSKDFNIEDNFLAFPSAKNILEQTANYTLPPAIIRFLREHSEEGTKIKYIHFNFRFSQEGREAAQRLSKIMNTGKNEPSQYLLSSF